MISMILLFKQKEMFLAVKYLTKLMNGWWKGCDPLPPVTVVLYYRWLAAGLHDKKYHRG